MTGYATDLIFSTLVSHYQDPIVAIPAIPRSAFQRRKIRIANVPFGGSKLTLRAWLLGETSHSIVISIRTRDSRLLAQKVRTVAQTGFFADSNLTAEFPQLPKNRSVDVEVDAQSDETRVWAFITATDFNGGRVKLHLPSVAK